ncbi:AHH domain-containing protein [Parablastomonas sp. CN1-191]|uniref:AHH domain-containing protein n=1 Tax=Parablastomonas sp. CN1-191 TaxID=3400908 RepID=UPI003BF886E7
MTTRPVLPFRAVNRPGTPGHDPGLQRHHLLPRQLLSRRAFARLFRALGPLRLGFEDFRRNGLLLPADDAAAIRMGLPLHRGPHRDYNALVEARMGQIEAGWARARLRDPAGAIGHALGRMTLLQRALRGRLLDRKRRLLLSRRDPFADADFGELEAMAALLWDATEPDA